MPLRAARDRRDRRVGRPGALSWWPLQLLRRYGFAGEIYPINPGRDEIDGVRCYPALADVPGAVDLAIVALGADRTEAAVRECADAGVRGVVLPAQGFGELGAEGRAKEAAILALARAHGMRVVGPNTDGIANFAIGSIASIQPVLDARIPVGPIAVVAQSGATAGSLIARLNREGLGCRYYAAAGNEIDLGLADYISFVLQDPEVEIVLSFVEGLRRPQDFVRVAALAAELGKPIALIKVGRSEQGARRAAAHTGALAGADDLYEALFRAHGVIRVSELSELVAIAKLHLRCPPPRTTGVGIVSVSGGQAGAVADKAVQLGLEVPQLEADAERAIDAMLEHSSGFNPCDLTGQIATDPELAGRVVDVLARQPSLSTIVYARKHLTGTVGPEAALSLAAARAEAPSKTIAVYAMDGVVEGAEAAVYDEHGIPVFGSLEELFVAIDRLAGYARFLARGGAAAPPTDPPATGPLFDGPELLAEAGIATPGERLVHDAAEAVAAASSIGFPVVLKVADERILHKTEAGGVVLGLRNPADVEKAYARLSEDVSRHLDGDPPAGVVVQEQVEGGVELIVGVEVDPDLGPFVLVGLGGVLTEVLRDTALRPAPVAEAEVIEMLERASRRSAAPRSPRVAARGRRGRGSVRSAPSLAWRPATPRSSPSSRSTPSSPCRRGAGCAHSTCSWCPAHERHLHEHPRGPARHAR